VVLTWREYTRASKEYTSGSGVRETFKNFYRPNLRNKKDNIGSVWKKIEDTATFSRMKSDKVLVKGQEMLWTPQMRAMYDILKAVRGEEGEKGTKILPGSSILITKAGPLVLYRTARSAETGRFVSKGATGKIVFSDHIKDAATGRFVSAKKAEGAAVI